MLTTIVVASVLGAAQQQSLYQRIVPRPTGRNGYEEYVQAADIASTVRLRTLNEALDSPGAAGTRLELQRAVAAATVGIVPLIRQGNEKPVFYPGALTFETVLPELTHLSAIGTSLVTKARVDFADGRVNEGFETLLTTITLGERLSFVGPLVHDLVGRAISLQAFRAISENLALISVPAAKRMDRLAAESLQAGNAWANSLKFELDVFTRSKITHLEVADLLGLDDDLGLDFTAISDERQRAIWSELEFALTRHYSAQIEAVLLPERDWIQAASKSLGQAKPNDPVASRIFDMIVPNSSRAILYEIVRRTHLRLLRVVAAVVEFKWNHGYYPGSLAQLPEQAVTHDPLTALPFFYERMIGGFTVLSEGAEGTGRIGLDWSSRP